MHRVDDRVPTTGVSSGRCGEPPPVATVLQSDEHAMRRQRLVVLLECGLIVAAGVLLTWSVGNGVPRSTPIRSAWQAGAHRTGDGSDNEVAGDLGYVSRIAALPESRWIGVLDGVRASLRDPARPQHALPLNFRGQVASCLDVLDERSVVVSYLDGSLVLWELESDERARPRLLASRDPPAVGCAVSPDRRTIAVGYADGTIFLWDYATGASRQLESAPRSQVTTMCFGPDGRRLYGATQSQPGDVFAWDVATGTAARFSGHRHLVSELVVSPDGTRVISGSFDGTIRVWNALTGDELQRVDSEVINVTALARSPDGRQLACGGTSRAIVLYELPSLDLIGTLGEHDGCVSELEYLQNGRLISGAADGTIRLWETTTGRELRRIGRRVGDHARDEFGT